MMEPDPQQGPPASSVDSRLGETQQRVLDRLRRRGPLTLAELAGELGLSSQAVREHVHALAGRGLIEKRGTRRSGPGRPSTLYTLTAEALDLFPNRESQLLEELTRYLLNIGHEKVLSRFFDQRVREARRDAQKRLEGLEGERRIEEAARIMTERGFMAELVRDGPDETPRLCLCHCPLRHVVNASKLPCRAELRFLRSMLGDAVSRETWMPDGDATCTYTLSAGSGADRGNKTKRQGR